MYWAPFFWSSVFEPQKLLLDFVGSPFDSESHLPRHGTWCPFSYWWDIVGCLSLQWFQCGYLSWSLARVSLPRACAAETSRAALGTSVVYVVSSASRGCRWTRPCGVPIWHDSAARPPRILLVVIHCLTRAPCSVAYVVRLGDNYSISCNNEWPSRCRK